MSKYKLTIRATGASFDNVQAMTSILVKTQSSFSFNYWNDKLIVKNIPSKESAKELVKALHFTQRRSFAGFSVDIRRQLF